MEPSRLLRAPVTLVASGMVGVADAVPPPAPAVGASSPMLAVAVLALPVEVASMLTPGSSVEAVLGASG